MQYFANCQTVAEIKKLYRNLAMQHHPDRGGDTATMQEINDQYAAALKACDGQTSVGDDQQEHTYRYDAEDEQAIVEFIDRLIKSGVLSATVEAWLIGKWVWITGETKPIRHLLGKEGLGCEWHSQRVAWYWKPYAGRSYYNRRVGLDGLAAQYGASSIKSDEDAKAGRKQGWKSRRRQLSAA